MKITSSLTGRFLILTVIFVMLAEVFIFLPSVGRFRLEYLRERLDQAQIASLALLATRDDQISLDLRLELLRNAEVLNIVLRRDEMRELVLSDFMPTTVSQTYDLREPGFFMPIWDAIQVLGRSENRVIRVIGEPVKSGGLLIEASLMEEPLRYAMIEYGRNIFFLSLLISLLTAALLFLAVRRFIVKPIRKLVQHMIAYRDNPEDPSRIVQPTSRVLELSEAEFALSDLQTQLTQSLRQKDRLAALGGAVSRISHDLRNMLTTAQLIADRMERSEDPTVRRSSPKLLGSLDRAIRLCESTLAFGKAEEPAPEIRMHNLSQIVDDVIENDRLRDTETPLALISEVDETLELPVDPEQIYRVFSNLIRNARQAITGSGQPGEIRVSAFVADAMAQIEIADTGPGLPPKAQENIFQPFKGGARRGGTGLGLAIAAELVRGHGGRLELVQTSAAGTRFRILLPAQMRNAA
ncbi:MAG: HAMP domain-containing sensor histidine kinase [Pseudomonadota bacterium]